MKRAHDLPSLCQVVIQFRGSLDGPFEVDVHEAIDQLMSDSRTFTEGDGDILGRPFLASNPLEDLSHIVGVGDL